MRLGTLFLTAAVAAAQTPGGLPWASATALPWSSGPCAQPVPPAFTRPPTALPLRVHLAQDGALRINDDKGILRLRMGLPGRPMKLWRDWGLPVATSQTTLDFPQSTPLSQGIGALPVESPDFRPALEGLLWILDDDEKFITLLHPATGQAVYLPLPGGRNLDLGFHPDRLEVHSGGPNEPCWSIPWMALLPQFVQLGQDSAQRRPAGTVLVPFKD